MEANRIIQGDALTVLKTIPDESINCVVTSPPYWRIRDFGVKPIIWDGDSSCKHEWGEKIIPLSHKSGETNLSNRNWFKDSQFCLKCGAWKGNLGLEPNYELYLNHLCNIFDEVKRVLRKDGTCWIDLGDNYISKSLCLIPFRFAIEMVNRGWLIRNVIIWYKPNVMPSSVKDRFTVDFNYIFFFTKSKKYWFEQQFEALKESSIKRLEYGMNSNKSSQGKYPIGVSEWHAFKDKYLKGQIIGRNKRCVWEISTRKFHIDHFAIYPAESIRTCIQAGCPKSGIVLDPFAGSGTTLEEAIRQGKNYIGIELNEKYVELAKKRISKVQTN